MTTTKSLAAWQSEVGAGNNPTYWPICGGGYMQVWTTEGFAQSAPNFATSFAQLTAYFFQTLAGVTTLRFRVNAANGNQIITAIGTGLVTDATHSDAASAGALVNYFFTSAGIYTAYITCVQMGSSKPYVISGSGPSQRQNGFPFVNPSFFTNILGDCSGGEATSSLSNQQYTHPAGKTSGFAFNIQSAPASTASGQYYLNGSAGNQSVAGTAVGLTYDATHTDMLPANSYMNLQWAISAQSGTFCQWQLNFAGTISEHPQVGSVQVRQSSTTWWAAFAGFISNNSTQPQTTIPCPFGAKCSFLLYTSDTTVGGAGGAVTFINSGSAGNMIVSSNGSSGAFSDTTHHDNVIAGGTFVAEVTTTTGAFDVSMVGFGLDDLSNTGSHPASFAAIQG